MSLENPKTTGTTTILYVVKSVQNRLRKYTMREYKYLEQIIIECYTNLNIFHLNNIEVVYLRMSDAKTVDLPADFIDYTKIGIPINGKLKVLTKNQNILLPREFEDGEEVGNTDNSTSTDTSSIYFVGHFRHGRYVGGLYGAPGGRDQAYYRVDKEMRTIAFTGSVPRSEIVLEYISSGVKLSGQTIIPRECVGLLQNYAQWHYYLSNKDSRYREFKNEYYGDVEEIRAFQTMFTKDEYLQHVYKHSRQSPKR